MTEHTFVLSGSFLLDDVRATERAADLVERLTEEIAHARHSWAAIEALAFNLLQLARLMARLAAPSPSQL